YRRNSCKPKDDRKNKSLKRRCTIPARRDQVKNSEGPGKKCRHFLGPHQWTSVWADTFYYQPNRVSAERDPQRGQGRPVHYWTLRRQRKHGLGDANCVSCENDDPEYFHRGRLRRVDWRCLFYSPAGPTGN